MGSVPPNAPAVRTVAIDRALAQAVSCDVPAPGALAAALREGIVLGWRRADRLLPDAKLERSLVRWVRVRAATAWVCGGRVIVADPSFRVAGPRGAPVEIVAASALRPSVVFAVGADDVAVAPPAGDWRVTARDGFTAYGVWDLGEAR